MLDARARARLARSRSAFAGAALVGTLVLFALVGPLAASHGALESDFAHGVSPESMPVGPNHRFLFGSDRLFRDVFARLAYAGRLSLFISVSSTAIACAIGATVGVVAGWTEGRRVRVAWPGVAGAAGAAAAIALGWPRVAALTLAAGLATAGAWRAAGPQVDLDGVLMRLVDVMLAFPFLLLVMAVGSALGATSAATILFTLGATGWLGIARVLRAKTMQVRSLDYIVASRALGQSTARILVAHVLPNVLGPLLVSATMLIAQMIVADSVLAYFGFGMSPPTPTWGRMLSEGQDYYLAAPWLVAAPAAAIVLSVWGFNLLGEGLRDAIDPRAT